MTGLAYRMRCDLYVKEKAANRVLFNGGLSTMLIICCENIVFGGGARCGMQPDTLGRNIAEAIQQISEGCLRGDRIWTGYYE